MSDLDSQLLPLLTGEAADCDAIVLRAHPGDTKAVQRQAGTNSDLSRRALERPLWMLHIDEDEHRIAALGSREDELGGEAERAYIDFLRECEMTIYSSRPGVYLPSAANFHYSAPNGRHYEAFLRVGSMLNSVEAVEALCFWLAPTLAEVDVVLLDSPSILSLGLRAKRYVAEATKRRREFEVETLREYDEPAVAFIPRIKTFARTGQRRSRLAFLVSMASSGRLANRVVNACRVEGFTADTLAIFASPLIDDSTPLCRIDGVGTPQPEPCALCERHSSAAKILPDTYTLDLAVHAQRAVIGQDDAEPGKALLRRYRDSDFVSLHRSEPGGRHHAIYLDCGKLLASQQFGLDLHAHLDPLKDEVGAILSPEHEAATLLAAVASERLKIKRLARDQTRIPTTKEAATDPAIAEWLSDLRRRPTLLLIDDVVITGRRLRNYLLALEPLSDELGVRLKVVYLVGISRPSHRDDLKAIPQMLMGRGRFSAVHEIVLPNWGFSDCPWCQERKDLERLGVEGTMAERLKLLSELATGLRGDQALLWWRGEKIDHLSRSIFGEGDDCQLFVSIAAAVQRLRNEERLDETFRLPVARVLDVHRNADTRFFEHRIFALILRACRPHDVLARPVEHEIIEHLRNRLACEQQPGELDRPQTLPALREHRAEIVLAAAHGKLPLAWLARGGEGDQDRRVIDEVLRDGEPATCSFLRRLIEG